MTLEEWATLIADRPLAEPLKFFQYLFYPFFLWKVYMDLLTYAFSVIFNLRS